MVYRARQEAFDRVVAVKVLTMPAAEERARRRFERELALAGRLTGHPNVVTVFASGFLADGRGYIQMEYCPGGSLADRLTGSGVLPVRDVVGIGVKMCGVLELASREGIVHRDVKPANILVTRFGEPALSDFGVALVIGELTETTQGLTPVHAAPEVLESRPAGPPADQWSLASTLHTLLAGRPPFAGPEGEGMLAGMLRVIRDPVPAIPGSEVPDGLQSALERAMAKSPGDRWPSPAEMGRSLQAVERQAGWPVTALPVDEVADARSAPPAEAGPVRIPSNELTTPRPRLDPRPDRRAGGPQPPAAPRAGDGGPAPPGGSLPLSPPIPTSAEPTGVWSRRSDPTPPAPETPVPKWRRWPVAAAGGLVVVGAVIAVIILTTSSGSSGPAGGKPAPRLQAPSPALAATLAPRHVEVVDEQPSTVTIRWVDPNNGIYPFVVRLSNGSVQTAASTTQTVVTGLDPAKGYCFVVGAVYGVGGQIADAPPVCVRGGTM